jgi:lantibiotic modifying enzyme
LKLEIPAVLKTKLEKLAVIGVPMDQGMTWPGDFKSSIPVLGSGWCTGSAGYVLLWVKAYDVLEENAYLELANKATRWFVQDPEQSRPHICCGVSGKVLSLLKMYQCAEDEKWLYSARRLMKVAIQSDHPPQKDVYNLFWGDLGILYAYHELKSPEFARFPLADILNFL